MLLTLATGQGIKEEVHPPRDAFMSTPSVPTSSAPNPSAPRLLKLSGALFPVLLSVLGLLLVVRWVRSGPLMPIPARVPGLDQVPAEAALIAAVRPQPGEPILGPGRASTVAAAWPCFRGPDRDAINKETVRLARSWPAAGPKRLWSVPLCDGFAAAAVEGGRVFVLDYDVERSADTLRCLSLDDGREIWRNAYPVVVAHNHGMSRTIPTVVGGCVITLGPKCQLACWDAATGKSRWLIDLVLEHGATVPPWYAGQCPFVDSQTDRLIVAPGGKALVMAIDYHSGKIIWQSPNPHQWAMTHVSIVPMEFAGRRMYVYCGKGGVAGIAADNGALLWETDQWQIAMATCPSPVVVGAGRIFFCGGYNSGSLMLQLHEEGGRIVPQTVFRLTARQFGSEQQTPVLWQQHLYAVRQKDQQLVCMDLDGKELWNSGRDKFGSGPYLIADGLIYVLDDNGVLSLAEATPTAYHRTARAQVIEDGSSSWGPMALAAGRLIVRDSTRMVCVDVAEDGR
jgi:outer membrane protein assembly factor BamB